MNGHGGVLRDIFDAGRVSTVVVQRFCKPKVGGSNPSPGTILLRADALRRTESRHCDEAVTTILVAGGAGYIGSHVCKALAEAGDKPVCYDTLEKGHDWAVQWGPLERGDIGDKARLDEVFARHRPQAVIHLAGYIEVGELVRQPERYLHNNATKTDALIDAALRHDIEAFVFSSSCAVYGLPQTDLLAETHPIAPISPYAEFKAQGRAGARRGRRSRPALGVVALLQRRRRRLRRDDRRGARSGDPSAAAGRRCRAWPRPGRSRCSAPIIRRPTARASATSCM